VVTGRFADGLGIGFAGCGCAGVADRGGELDAREDDEFDGDAEV
jgi:hypothetical protein